MAERGILIGIAGGSGSGKTLVAKNIYADLGSDKVVRVCQDSYYKDLSHLTKEERLAQNFDHPHSMDTELLLSQVKALLDGDSIKQPIYDFVNHVRKPGSIAIGPHLIIVLDGILIFNNPELRKLMDIKIFVDTASDIRLTRRLRRDILERGRAVEDILEQYEKSVRPMHMQFVEPSKMHADIIIPEGGYNRVAIDVIKTKIQALLRERGEL